MITIPRKGQARVYGASNGGVAVTNWFGTGVDGDLHVTAGEKKEIDVVKDSGQILLNLENLTIDEGGILQPSQRCNGMILLVRGDLTLNGTISVDKCAPCINDEEEYCRSRPWIRILNLVGGNGGKGGNGYVDTSVSTRSPYYTSRSSGGAGGSGFWCGGGSGGGGGGGGASYSALPDPPDTPSNVVVDSYYRATPAAGGSAGVRAISLPYTNPSSSISSSGAYGTGGNSSMSTKGGAAPGGSGASVHHKQVTTQYNTSAINHQSSIAGSPGDAYGGGGIWIYVKGKVFIGSTGIVSACGGNGANAVVAGYQAFPGAGGGGGGGIIAIIHNGDFTNNGKLKADGGFGGVFATSGSGWSGDAASAGTAGSATQPYVASLDEVFANITA